MLLFGIVLFLVFFFSALLTAKASDTTEVNYEAVVVWTLICVLVACFGFKNTSTRGDAGGKALREIGLAKRFAPPVEALLIIKALFFVTISLQLIYPAASLVPGVFRNTVVAVDQMIGTNYHEVGSFVGDIELAEPRPLLFCAFELGNTTSNASVERGCPPSGVDNDISYFTLFENRHEETVWIIAALFVIALLFLAEFDWINRSMIAERQSSALGLTPRYPADNRAHSHLDPVWMKEAHARIEAILPEHFPGGEEEREKLLESISKPKEDIGHERRVAVLRRIERATLPWLIVRVWMPAIVVRVNLGFDTLDHRGVTRAMLFGLRSEYQKKFLDLFSGYAVLVNFVTVMGVILTVSYVGESAFDFPRIRYVTQESDCRFAKDGNLKRFEEQGCAVFKPWSPAWKGFFESDPDGKAREGELDYCAILSNRLSRIPEARLRNENGPVLDSDKYDEYFPAGNATIPRMLCDAAPGAAELLLPILFAAVLPVDIDPRVVAKHENSPGHLVFSFLHDNQGLPHYADGAIRTEPSLSLRVYHVLTFLALLALWNWLSRRFSIHPYRSTVSSIDALIESLDARSTHRRRSALLEPIARAFTHEREEEVAREQLDPRSVELALLDVLEEVRHTEKGLFGGAMTLPVPELTFVFDELDKISGTVGAGTNAASSAGIDKTALDQERRRAYALHQLLSDMKRVISAAPARFIFVGNRLLHDEWMADRSRRQPLLTSIFDTEVYLPSLMLDSEGTLGAGRPQKRLSHRTKEYLAQRHRSAGQAYRDFVEDRLSPFPLLRLRGDRTTPYPQDAPVADWAVTRPKDDTQIYAAIDLLRIEGQERRGRSVVELKLRTQFLRAFCHFLTFRSGGNPKKLQELLNEFVRPAARLSHPGDTARWIGDSAVEPLHCEDVLYIHGRSIYRVQLIDTLYMHLIERFEQELIDRDDKVVEAILYLFDFLMKFHGRAFSWSSLERVEDLVYIHRTPDVRAILARIVEDASERWLHRLLNGMYDFRFRSDFAIELRFLSRLNQAEAAALNFTLDEAQGLKATYIALLRETGETNGRRDHEAIAGLGELHEYDQEFGEARSSYLEAIDEIDERFRRLAGETIRGRDPIRNKAEAAAVSRYSELRDREAAVLGASLEGAPPPVPVMRAIMGRDPEGMRVAAVHFPWAIRRLRLMLQVAMTYELSRDFEPAKVHYLDARLFAWSLIEMFPGEADEEGERFAVATKKANIEAANDLAKHINLLYQPIFAEAWISEKLENGIDTACSLVEGDLLRLRRRLPFLRDLDATKDVGLEQFVGEDGNPRRDAGAGDSNMALIGAELHNKAGDLYFYKGRGVVPHDSIRDYLMMKEKHEEEMRLYFDVRERSRSREKDRDESVYGSGSGMLLRAHYHYAIGLHELRRYLVYRRLTSGAKMNPLRGHYKVIDKPGRPIGKKEWPTFVPQSIYNNLSDMAETVLARVSFFSLMRAAAADDEWNGEGWTLFYPPDDTKHPRKKDGIERFSNGLEDWFEKTDDEIKQELSRRTPRWLRYRQDGGDLVEHHLRLLYDTLGLWVGNAEGRLKDAYPHLVTFGSLETQAERLAIGFAFSIEAARLAERAGYPEDAARESLLVMELCARYLKWIEITEVLREYGPPEVRDPLNEILGHGWSHEVRSRLGTLKRYLGRIALDAAVYYDHLVWKAWRREPYPEGCLLGQPVNPEAVTMVCSLASLFEGKHLGRRLMELARKWLGECKPEGESPEDYLRHTMRSFRYPALNQLLARKSLIDRECLRIIRGEKPKGSDPVDLHIELEHLQDTYAKLSAPLHFTPAMLGETAALVAIADLFPHKGGKIVKTSIKKEQDQKQERMIRRAIEALTASRETYSMGRAYYSAIAEMYYLYDDYNDRRIHANHAAQMAGGELHAFLLHVMEKLAKNCRRS